MNRNPSVIKNVDTGLQKTYGLVKIFSALFTKGNFSMEKKKIGSLVMGQLFLACSSLSATELVGSGFFSSLSTGYSHGSIGVKDSRFNSAPGGADFVWNKKSTGIRGLANIELSFGYRSFLNNRYFLGVVTGLGLDSGKFTKENRSPNGSVGATTRVETSYKITPAFVLGTRLSDVWLLSTELGLGTRKFQVNHDFHTLNIASEPTVSSFTATKAGFSGKIVIERSFSNNASLFVSGGYEHYGTVRKGVKLIGGLAGERNSVTLTPSYVTTNVGIMYRF